MSENDAGLIFAKLLVMESELKNMTKNFEDHNIAALKRQEDYHKSLDVVISKLDCQTKRCFDHAPVIDGFGKHLTEHSELKIEQNKRFFTLMIAMGGWSLVLIELFFKFFSK
jgi:hypothetical protein